VTLTNPKVLPVRPLLFRSLGVAHLQAVPRLRSISGMVRVYLASDGRTNERSGPTEMGYSGRTTGRLAIPSIAYRLARRSVSPQRPILGQFSAHFVEARQSQELER
jgi:hypothetical protein